MTTTKRRRSGVDAAAGGSAGGSAELMLIVAHDHLAGDGLTLHTLSSAIGFGGREFAGNALRAEQFGHDRGRWSI